jgi:serine O-acetyltransferase
VSIERLTWRQTGARIRADKARVAAWLQSQNGRPVPAVRLHPSFVCVLLYRLSNHFYRAGHRYIARLLWHINFMVTGADISEPADLGEGLLILSPPGTAIMGTAGRNLTVMPCAGLGSDMSRDHDIGAGPGLPLLGDDVVLEPHCGVLGPTKVGNRVRVPAGLGLTQDVGDDVLICGPEPRFLRRSDV